MKKRAWVAAAAAWLLAAGIAGAAPAPDSKRLGLAKDYIADEQWARAIVELQAVANDPKETNRDEALFWLAHSEHQMGDDAAAIQTIARLEREYRRSRWVRPAGSLRVEIAQRLRRDDFLWMLVAQPQPPRPTPAGTPPPAIATTPPAGAPPVLPAPPAGRRPLPVSSEAPPAPPASTPPTPFAVPPRQPGPTPAPPAAPPRARGVPQPATTPPPTIRVPSEFWTPGEALLTDTNIRIEALGSLLESHGDRAIPLLRDIALDGNSPDEARRAVFVLAQSRRVDARNTVFEVARRGSEPVKIAAIREIGRFDGPAVSAELLKVYSTASTPRVKRQVVISLGERADNGTLMRIARDESDVNVRNTAIVTLGRIGARGQLRNLYMKSPMESRMAVLTALFTAKDDEELIEIAKTERDPRLRLRARQQLRLLATPRALKFLEENP
jgi:hypothetical protein